MLYYVDDDSASDNMKCNLFVVI